MANEYRWQLKGTGEKARHELLRLVREEDRRSDRVSVGYTRSYIRGWYNSLRRSLGNAKDLKGLYWCMWTMKEMSRLLRAQERGEYVDEYVYIQSLAKNALAHFDNFYKTLPSVIEKSLTRAVVKSGIHLPD